MDINELKATSQAVYKRISELDHEQFDHVRGRDTRNRGDLVQQAVTELVPAEWRDVVALLCEGASYYSRCEEWFA